LSHRVRDYRTFESTLPSPKSPLLIKGACIRKDCCKIQSQCSFHSKGNVTHSCTDHCAHLLSTTRRDLIARMCGVGRVLVSGAWCGERGGLEQCNCRRCPVCGSRWQDRSVSKLQKLATHEELLNYIPSKFRSMTILTEIIHALLREVQHTLSELQALFLSSTLPYTSSRSCLEFYAPGTCICFARADRAYEINKPRAKHPTQSGTERMSKDCPSLAFYL
jgi:hypothetical protein